MLIESINEVSEDYAPNVEFKGSTPFKALLNGLSGACDESEDGKIWLSETVFMQEYDACCMEPTVKPGAIIWVDTAQVPVLGNGPVAGWMYLLRGGHKIIAPHLWWVQPCIKGRFYWKEYTERRGDERQFLTLLTKEDYLKDNARYIGRVVGVVNPL